MTRDSVLIVEQLTKRYADFTAVADVSFTLGRGRTLALVGESGAGKSTIGAVVTGLTSATSGRVELVAEAGAADRRTRRGSRLQLVPQDPYSTLDPRQSIGSALDEAVTLAGRMSRADRSARTTQLLDLVGLSSEHARLLPRSLSGGQRQRVAIARALAADPDVLVLDEAVSALDVSVQAQVLNVLNRVQRESGTAYLFITHDFAVVRQIADEVLVLRGGRAVEYGSADQVLGAPEAAYTRSLLDATPRPGWRLPSAG
ncbi:ABC transporter family protein [Branchiibius hedensis]|uniref:ABC transporter n=1 Tax=Branchiibius hedensis TaxID=672460 RepID=A0A2Y8ZVU2_9MICO|nr:ATP-binding cassette domain-containing protein [Branchiibius hedensis]PWJ26845.1 ABC transporter family protein [Branchiibius hedensis]SSA35656.1 ABC transporter [Branchiibius hedensis]